MTAESEHTVSDDARSIVVHPTEAMNNPLACADF
jgi:hypothetical protein